MNYYKIQTGDIDGVASGGTPSIAARKLVREAEEKGRQPRFGMLARFKECAANGGNVLVKSPGKPWKKAVWMYQDIISLLEGDRPEKEQKDLTS